MKKTNNFKKIASKSFIHFIEIVLLYLVALGVQLVAPAGYAWPATILMGFVYVVYLVSSLVDDYLDMQGADFMI